MVLGYSYRYYDDNLDDNPEAGPRAYASSEVALQGESVIHRNTGTTLKERWVDAENVRWVDEKPLHPTLDLPLEEVTEKMSKSRGNVVNPDDVIERFGTDAMRLYEMFMGPIEKGAPWSDDAIPGLQRFLQRAYRMLAGEAEEGGETPALMEGDGSEEQARLTARTIHGVTEDIEAMRFNTAISKLMVFVRDVAREAPLPRAGAEAFVRLLCPFAPHLAEELWRCLGHETTLVREHWPQADAALLVQDVVTLAVQVNGKRRDEIEVPTDADEETIRRAALASEKVQRHLGGRAARKVIVVPGRLVNVVG
jgi:leucyl-tRNA synthetase